MRVLLAGITGLLLVACGDMSPSNAFLIKHECANQAGNLICEDGSQYELPDNGLDEPLDEPLCFIRENKNFRFITCGKSKFKIDKRGSNE